MEGATGAARGGVFGCVVPLGTALCLGLTLLEGLTHPKGTTRMELAAKGTLGAAATSFTLGPTWELKSNPGGFAKRLFLTLQPNFTLPA